MTFLQPYLNPIKFSAAPSELATLLVYDKATSVPHNSLSGCKCWWKPYCNRCSGWEKRLCTMVSHGSEQWLGQDEGTLPSGGSGTPIKHSLKEGKVRVDGRTWLLEASLPARPTPVSACWVPETSFATHSPRSAFSSSRSTCREHRSSSSIDHDDTASRCCLFTAVAELHSNTNSSSPCPSWRGPRL